MKKLSILIFTLILGGSIFYACEMPEPANNIEPEEGIDWDNFSVFEGFKINLDFPTEFDLNEITFQEIVSLVIEDMEGFGLDKANLRKSTSGDVEEAVDYIDGVDIIVKWPKVTILPVDPVELEGGCGSDGNWTDHGICRSESCVEEKVRKIGNEFKPKSGECLDVRVKRSPTQARVCHRLIKC